MRLEKPELLEKILLALEQSGSSILGITSEDHPFRIKIVKDGMVANLLIYIWNVTHGGIPRSEDEFRIQITVDKLEFEEDNTTLLLGWDEERQVFAGYNPYKYRAPGTNVSVQVRKEYLVEAQKKGLSIQIKEEDEEGNPLNIVIVFKPEIFSDYAFNLINYHKEVSIDKSDLDLLNDQSVTEEEIDESDLPFERKSRIINTKITIRDQSFKNRIMNIYGSRCAICGIGLNIVEAAHIVPVVSGGTDENCNGIALCPNHHDAFDRGIIIINKDYTIDINVNYINYNEPELLKNLEKFRVDFISEKLSLPEKKKDKPNVEYLKRKYDVLGIT